MMRKCGLFRKFDLKSHFKIRKQILKTIFIESENSFFCKQKIEFFILDDFLT